MSQQHNYHHYNKKLQPFARENRNAPTKAENHLWYQLLNDRKMLGYKFLRQRPVSSYIADFMCKDLWLIIEVDGSIHDLEKVREYDAIRQRNLEELGFSVLRFTNWEVLNDLHHVAEVIASWIRGREEGKGAQSPPLPPLKGG